MSAAANVRDPLRVGVVGLGVIGRHVCRALDAGLTGVVLAGATTRRRDAGEAFLATLKSPVPFYTLDDLIGAADLVVEASTQTHLAEIAPKPSGPARTSWSSHAAHCWARRWCARRAPRLAHPGPVRRHRGPRWCQGRHCP